MIHLHCFHHFGIDFTQTSMFSLKKNDNELKILDKINHINFYKIFKKCTLISIISVLSFQIGRLIWPWITYLSILSSSVSIRGPILEHWFSSLNISVESVCVSPVGSAFCINCKASSILPLKHIQYLNTMILLFSYIYPTMTRLKHWWYSINNKQSINLASISHIYVKIKN